MRSVVESSAPALPDANVAPPSAAPAEAVGVVDLAWLRRVAGELGFADLGIADIDLTDAEPGLLAWVGAGMHGEMHYFERHGVVRARPGALVAGTACAIMVVMDYAPDDPEWVDSAWRTLDATERAFVSRYALGRDYHKVVRARLSRLADMLAAVIGPFGHRVFCDSAPVLEVELAIRAGLGWRGKHTLLLSQSAGSTRFIGTLYTDLPLATRLSAEPIADHCGTCTRCIDICPTGAIVAPGRLDARRCISYLTIEHPGDIPVQWRQAIGNRIYGCDDCQLACPWNRFARATPIGDFAARESLDTATLVELFSWSAADFSERLAGSAIRRIGHARWQRNLAVAMGNALRMSLLPEARRAIERALRQWLSQPQTQRDALVARHVVWALEFDAGTSLESPPSRSAPVSSRDTLEGM